MRSRIFLPVIALLITTAAGAQNLRLNVSAGTDHARFAIAGASDGPISSRIGVGGGLGLEASLSPLLSLQLEANYAQQGTAVTNADGTSVGSFNLSTVTVPLLLRLHASSNLSLFAGPQVGFLLSAKSRNIGQAEQDVKEQLKSTDFFAVFGGEYRFANGVFLGARYHHGFQDLTKEDPTDVSDIKSRYLSFRLGYSFRL